jgi:hypothetical protein
VMMLIVPVSCVILVYMFMLTRCRYWELHLAAAY